MTPILMIASETLALQEQRGFRRRGLGGGGGWCIGTEIIPVASGVKTAESEMKQNNGGPRQYWSGFPQSQKEATEYTHNTFRE